VVRQGLAELGEGGYAEWGGGTLGRFLWGRGTFLKSNFLSALLNVIGSLKANKTRYGLIASCAGGGIGASIVVERVG